MNPYGSFYLKPELLRQCPDVVVEAFWLMKFVPFRAEYLYSNQRIFYTGISPNFNGVPDCEHPPEYKVKIITDNVDKSFQGIIIKAPDGRFQILRSLKMDNLSSIAPEPIVTEDQAQRALQWFDQKYPEGAAWRKEAQTDQNVSSHLTAAEASFPCVNGQGS